MTFLSHLKVRVDDLKIPDPYHASHNMRPETRRFCLFSIKFSPDNREILGGASDYCLYIYDQETEQRTVKITAHRDDINAVQWADESANVVFSGSDDTFCKVWDRRLLGESEGKPCGVMVGHLDGITHIDSKGDGRYFISNSKDQSIKLWDLRTMQNQVWSLVLLLRLLRLLRLFVVFFLFFFIDLTNTFVCVDTRGIQTVLRLGLSNWWSSKPSWYPTTKGF